MINNNDTLQLKYSFTSDPTPIRASVGGSSPGAVDLEIMVSNSGTDVVTLGKIFIRIPVGENIAGDLSSSPDLPPPEVEAGGDWEIGSHGDMVTIVPKPGTRGEITSAIIFSLKEIVVNEEPGVVPITITEVAPSGEKVSDKNSYSLVKLESDFPVTNFYAVPNILRNLDKPVTPPLIRWPILLPVNTQVTLRLPRMVSMPLW